MVNEELENDVLGFDPKDLDVNNPQPSTTSNGGNPNVYHCRPSEAKSDDGIYRSQIKIIYAPRNLKKSVLEQQSYTIQDEKGYLNLVSSLTNNDKSCPIFKAWKTCHFSENKILQNQALPVNKGGKGLFDKRFARYVTIQVMEDNNQPELVGKYMLWKCPKVIWEAINAKQVPSSDKKAKIPVMDFLFGRAIDLEVTPGPDDPKDPTRKTREISYATSEITEDIVSCTYPDGKPLLNSDEQSILDTYINEMTAGVWKEKDPEKRKANELAIKQNENTKKLGKIYRRVIEEIKEFCPDLETELGYKPWSPEEVERVNAWIKIVLSGNDPKTNINVSVSTPETEKAVDKAKDENPTTTQAASATTTSQTAPVETDNTDDLPF